MKGRIAAMKRNVKILLTALLIYAALLVCLSEAEAPAAESTIHGLADALWFSLITMTTVGYGDLAPVTPIGRMVGGIFALCSVGILSLLIGVALNLVGDRWIPRIRLRFGRKKPWYVFNAENPDSEALAGRLRREEKELLLVFPKTGKKLMSGPDVVRLDASAEQLLRLRGSPEGMAFLCLSENLWSNFEQGSQAAELSVPSYCMTEVGADWLLPELHLFSRSEALSRCYWSRHPVTDGEKRIIVIGCGEAGCAILERALLTNIFEPGRTLEYHVFADSAGFASLHPEIAEALSGKDSEEDLLVIHDGEWTEARELIGTADRIVLCADEDADNLHAYEMLRRWYATDAKIHLRLNEPIQGTLSFGDREEILTPEFVMRDEINRRAMLLNDLYNRSSDRPTAWRDLSHFLRQSNIAAADHLIIKARLLLGDGIAEELTEEVCRLAYAKYREQAEKRDIFQRIEHRRWMRFYRMYNWTYDPKRDDRHRHHPLLLPYGELSEQEQRKDSFAWELLGQLYENQSD